MLILADEPFTKALRSLETSVLVNKESLITFDESFKVTPVLFFIPFFKLRMRHF